MARASRPTFSKCVFTGLIFGLLQTIASEARVPCADNHFQCGNDRCIPKFKQCDGHLDCGHGDMTDEDPWLCGTEVLKYAVDSSPDIYLDDRFLVRVARQADSPVNETTGSPAVNAPGGADASATADNGTASSQNTTEPPAGSAAPTAAPSTTTTANATTQAPLTSQKTPKPESTKMPNITHDKENRKYYTIETIQRKAIYDRYWVDLSNNADGVIHKTLSEGHRLAQTIFLKFKFRFYGHSIKNVTIATGGFLYMSPFLHKFLTATQYIAPLMANFDTTLGNESNIIYLSTTKSLIVQWQNVHLQDQIEFGRFNFQVHLKASGEIIFVYKDVPVNVAKILEDKHPVKIGLSDAFYIDKDDKSIGMKRRTIYEYHRVSINLTRVLNSTVVLMEPNPTCNTATSCEDCLSRKPQMGCAWCGVVRRCSDGIDWHRQHWLDRGCKYLSSKKLSDCALYTTQSTTVSSNSPSSIPSKHASSTLPLKSTTSTATTSTSTTSTITPVTTSVSTSVSTSVFVPPSSQATTLAVIIVLCGLDVEAGKSNCSAIPNVKPTKGSYSKNNSGYSFPPGAVVALIILVALVIGVGGWFFYAYRNPTTASGIWLMEHRPVAMKTKLAKMKFWKQSTPTGDKYAVESEA